MKNNKELIIVIIIVLFCLFMSRVQAQERQIISIGIDPKLAIEGAYDYDNTPVAHIHFEWLTSLEKWEGGIRVSYANLQPYKYFDMGFLYNRKINLFKTEAVETLIGAEIGLIVRDFPLYDTQKAYFDYGINTQMRFWLSSWFGFYVKGSLSPRNDLDYYGSHQFAHFDGELGIVINF